MRLTFTIPMAVALLAGVLLSSPAQAGDTPAKLAGARVVNAEEVAKAIAGGAKVIDSRVAAEFAEGHIKGAINVPYREKSAKAESFDAGQDSFDLAKLPADKGAAIVIYCNGAECWKSFKASTVAIKAGYTNIHWYQSGFPDWKSKGLPSE